MKHFITFGAGRQNYYDACNRLTKQATNLNLFDNISCYTDETLKNDSDFWSKHSEFVKNNQRGYGCWLWKPYLIKKTIEKMNDGDILLYADCGCEIDIKEKEELKKYFEIVKKDYIMGTLTAPDNEWNKMDLILKLDMLNHDKLNFWQHQASVLLFLVCDKTRNLANEWYDLCCDYHNIDDSPSVSPNFSEFKEHRHDQSIFSLLTKKYNLFSNHYLENCIKIYRNISGYFTHK